MATGSNSLGINRSATGWIKPSMLSDELADAIEGGGGGGTAEGAILLANSLFLDDADKNDAIEGDAWLDGGTDLYAYQDGEWVSVPIEDADSVTGVMRGISLSSSARLDAGNYESLAYGPVWVKEGRLAVFAGINNFIVGNPTPASGTRVTLFSPDGTPWSIQVSNAGTITATEITITDEQIEWS
jgi:hypothetical protein